MKRRTFNKLAVNGCLGGLIPQTTIEVCLPKKAIPLKPGDTIGLIAPAFRIGPDKLKKAIANIEDLGFKAYYLETILSIEGYLAGSDERRVTEIHHMFQENSVAGIWSIDGGYGTTRLLDALDYRLIRKNPKPIIGFSDITALLSAIYKHAKSPCFHGPNLAYELTEYEKRNLRPLYGLTSDFEIQSFRGYQKIADVLYQPYIINPGKVRGKLLGGNLSVLISLLGTRHELKFEDAILFLEDIGEAPYRIDRMLTQLISSKALQNVNGIVLGIFHDCERAQKDTQSLREVLYDRLKPFNVPTIYGFSFSHVKNQCTFPIGVSVELDADAQRLTLLEDVYKTSS